jgi:hypothetical protein
MTIPKLECLKRECISRKPMEISSGFYSLCLYGLCGRTRIDLFVNLVPVSKALHAMGKMELNSSFSINIPAAVRIFNSSIWVGVLILWPKSLLLGTTIACSKNL